MFNRIGHGPEKDPPSGATSVILVIFKKYILLAKSSHLPSGSNEGFSGVRRKCIERGYIGDG